MWPEKIKSIILVCEIGDHAAHTQAYKHSQGHKLIVNAAPRLLLKCPYNAFSNITFHAVCHVAVCEHKRSAQL